jgi:tetratricopeptide (TPR) repeat protein
MFLSRYSSLATVIIIALAVAVSSAPAFCAEAATQEQNLALLKVIDANLLKKPDNILFQLQHAEMMGRLKRYDEQIIEANKLLSKNPNLRDAYLIRSDGEANQKRYAEALVSLDKAFKLGAPTPKLLLQKARYLRNEKKYETAIAVLDPLIALEPSNIDAYKCRSACYFYLYGPCDKALQDMEKVVLLNPSDSIAVGLVADLKRELKSQALTKGK